MCWFVLIAWCYRRCLLYHWRTRRPSQISWSGSPGTLTATTSSTEGWPAPPPPATVAMLLVNHLGVTQRVARLRNTYVPSAVQGITTSPIYLNQIIIGNCFTIVGLTAEKLIRMLLEMLPLKKTLLLVTTSYPTMVKVIKLLRIGMTIFKRLDEESNLRNS